MNKPGKSKKKKSVKGGSGGGAVAVTEPQPLVIESPLHGGTEEERSALQVRIITRDVAPSVAVAEPRSGGDGPPIPEGTTVRNPDPPELSAGTPKRAFALDALRGLFLISMTAGFTIASDHLPAWMYHRQMPPGTEDIVPIPGISWRDLAYASFLFTMAAALPLTLSRRIEKGAPELGIIFAAIKRYGMLIFFGLLVAHSNTYFIGYTQTGRALSLAGFAIMAMVLTRRRKDWSEDKFDAVNRAGWILAIAFLLLSPLTYGKRFSFARIDDIMSELAFASFAGMVLWYFTRTNVKARLVALAITVGLFLAAKIDGPVQHFWYASPAEWAFEPARLLLLTVVVPGTIAGDVILRWMRTPSSPDVRQSWSGGRLAALATLCALFTPVMVVGMYNRQSIATLVACAAMAAGGLYLVRRPSTPTERMLRSLYLWAAAWMLIGLAIEPFEGMKKAPDTLSYFFAVTGTTSMLLVTLTTITDALKRSRAVAVLIDIGHNPLLCYVLFTVFLNSLFEITPVTRGLLMDTPGQTLIRSGICLILTILIVRYVSRKKIYWRT